MGKKKGWVTCAEPMTWYLGSRSAAEAPSRGSGLLRHGVRNAEARESTSNEVMPWSGSMNHDESVYECRRADAVLPTLCFIFDRTKKVLMKIGFLYSFPLSDFGGNGKRS